jgi:hypothetical protein
MAVTLQFVIDTARMASAHVCAQCANIIVYVSADNYCYYTVLSLLL